MEKYFSCEFYTSIAVACKSGEKYEHTWVSDMSPYNARASVLGIGVADMARTWGAIEKSTVEVPSESSAAIFELKELLNNYIQEWQCTISSRMARLR